MTSKGSSLKPLVITISVVVTACLIGASIALVPGAAQQVGPLGLSGLDSAGAHAVSLPGTWKYNFYPVEGSDRLGRLDRAATLSVSLDNVYLIFNQQGACALVMGEDKDGKGYVLPWHQDDKIRTYLTE